MRSGGSSNTKEPSLDSSTISRLSEVKMMNALDDECKAILGLLSTKNTPDYSGETFVFQDEDDDDDDGLTGELACLEFLSSLQQELDMSDHYFDDEFNAKRISKASMEQPAALVEEEDTVKLNLIMEQETCTPWKPTHSQIIQDTCAAMPSETQSSHCSNTIQFFTQMARDIQLAEGALTENGVERSLARQIAVSTKLETQKLVMESHQRNLDRRLSQRQHEERMMMESYHRNQDRQLSKHRHEESIQAAKYDPDWIQKLEEKRDKCLTATKRTIFLALGFHYLPMSLKPILKCFSAQSYLPFQELGILVIDSICDCGSSGDKIASSSAFTSLFTSRTLFVLERLGLDYISTMDAGMCYGYCLFSFGFTAVLTATVHQGLRIVSAPSLIHQMVNGIALAAMLGGPNALLSRYFTTEALLSFSIIHLLGIVFLLAPLLVHLKHCSCKKRVQEASKSPKTFHESFETSLEQLDRLYSKLCFCQYIIIAIFGTYLFMNAN